MQSWYSHCELQESEKQWFRAQRIPSNKTILTASIPIQRRSSHEIRGACFIDLLGRLGNSGVSILEDTRCIGGGELFHFFPYL